MPEDLSGEPVLMYVTTDKDLFSRWLSDLAGKAIETCLQRRQDVLDDHAAGLMGV